MLRLAEEHRFPVTPRASGTNLSGGAVPLQGGVVLSCARMRRLIEIDEQNLTATCEPGLQNALLQEAVAAKGLFYPPDPGSQVISTIGGNVMECSGGLRGLKYGITRDYVIGLEAVLIGGRFLRVGGKLTKDVAGYDLVRLLVGSEGTLAVLTEITLKLLPAPPAKATGAAYFRNLEASARSVSRIIENRILPATLEFLDQTTMRVVDESADLGLPADAGAMLIFGQDGAASVVERDTAKMAEICREEGALSVEVAADEDAAGKLLAARRGAIPALARLAPTLILEDATVPRSELAGMVREVQRIAEEEGLLIAVFGHAGDGNLHPTCCIDERDPDQVARVHRAFERIFEAALARGRHDHRRARHRRHEAAVSGAAPRAGRHRLAARHQAGVRPARVAQSRQGGAVTAPGRLDGWPRAVSGRSAAHVHLVRVLPLGLSDLSGHPQRGVLSARPDQPHARPRSGSLGEDDVREELSFCLGCRACEPVCPAGVRYGTLLEHGRDAIGPAREPKLRGLLLAVGTPRRTRLAGRMMRVGQLLGLHRIAPSKALRAAGRAAPMVGRAVSLAPAPSRRRRGWRAGRPVPRLRRPSDVLPCRARGLRHARDGRLPRDDAARAGLLRRAACAQRRPRGRAEAGRLDGAVVRGQRGADRHDRRRPWSLHGRLRNPARYPGGGGFRGTCARLLHAAGRPRAARLPRRPLRVAYQDSCHLRNGQQVTHEPRALLASLPGVEVVDLPSAGRCCGAAGTYALMRPDDSLRFLDAKLGEIAEAGVDAIVERQPGLPPAVPPGRAQRAELKGVRVLHTAEVVAERMPR